MESDFIKCALKNGDVIDLNEALERNILDKDDDVEFYIGEQVTTYSKYKIGDIVYISNYIDNRDIQKHLFVIIDDDNYAVDLTYFSMLLSSNLDKLKYKSNVLLKKDELNKLKKDSIVKTDIIYSIKNEQIDFLVGVVPISLIEMYKKIYLDNKNL